MKTKNQKTKTKRHSHPVFEVLNRKRIIRMRGVPIAKMTAPLARVVLIDTEGINYLFNIT